MAHLRSAWARGLAATAVGAVLVTAWWAVFHFAPNLIFLHLVDCGPNPSLSCGLGGAIVGVVLGAGLGIAVSVLVGWLLLWLIGVRPAWQVALAGPLLAGALALLTNPLTQHLFGQSIMRTLIPVAIGYGLTALLVARRTTA